MVNYTIHGLAHLLHVVWPISKHLIITKQCRGFDFTSFDEEMEIDQEDINAGMEGIINSESWLERLMRRGNIFV
ncbi:unnamed protein product [Meloidogyne enterolobii]|uniref:Uncharacterized protein n=1 Tax=Meloidogyne enterolobii TaxID=390850 RepID=A0ACB0XQ02_MELEN